MLIELQKERGAIGRDSRTFQITEDDDQTLTNYYIRVSMSRQNPFLSLEIYQVDESNNRYDKTRIMNKDRFFQPRWFFNKQKRFRRVSFVQLTKWLSAFVKRDMASEWAYDIMTHMEPFTKRHHEEDAERAEAFKQQVNKNKKGGS